MEGWKIYYVRPDTLTSPGRDSTYRIREFEERDAPRAEGILALTSRYHDDETESARFLIEASRDPGTEMMVAEEGGEAAAVCRGVVGRKAMILQLYVHPERQGRGMGTALVREMCSRFRSRGADRAYATVDDRCRPYWKRLGFSEASNRLVFKDL